MSGRCHLNVLFWFYSSSYFLCSHFTITGLCLWLLIIVRNCGCPSEVRRNWGRHRPHSHRQRWAIFWWIFWENGWGCFPVSPNPYWSHPAWTLQCPHWSRPAQSLLYSQNSLPTSLSHLLIQNMPVPPPHLCWFSLAPWLLSLWISLGSSSLQVLPIKGIP